jgi:hypothetical protein
MEENLLKFYLKHSKNFLPKNNDTQEVTFDKKVTSSKKIRKIEKTYTSKKLTFND